MSCISAWAAKSNCFSNIGIVPYCSSDILFKSLARLAISNSTRALSNADLMCLVPESAAFSVRQISSSSLNLSCFSANSSAIVDKRLILAESSSFSSACRSILS